MLFQAILLLLLPLLQAQQFIEPYDASQIRDFKCCSPQTIVRIVEAAENINNQIFLFNNLEEQSEFSLQNTENGDILSVAVQPLPSEVVNVTIQVPRGFVFDRLGAELGCTIIVETGFVSEQGIGIFGTGGGTVYAEIVVTPALQIYVDSFSRVVATDAQAIDVGIVIEGNGMDSALVAIGGQVDNVQINSTSGKVLLDLFEESRIEVLDSIIYITLSQLVECTTSIFLPQFICISKEDLVFPDVEGNPFLPEVDLIDTTGSCLGRGRIPLPTSPRF